MLLRVNEIKHLPLVAALMSVRGNTLAHTPEWRELAPEAISYPILKDRLIVNPMTPSHVQPGAVEAMRRLLEELAKSAAAAPSGSPQRARLRMLEVSLRAVIGRTCETNGDIHDLVISVRAGAEARTGGIPSFDVKIPESHHCSAPEAIALVLVQMIVNAHEHANVEVKDIQVTIHNDRRFGVGWPGRPPLGVVSASRMEVTPKGWGLSFAQTIADTLGGKIYPPRADGPDRVRTACELDVNRVVIPLAQVGSNHSIIQASPTWTEETGWTVHDAVTGEVWTPLIRAAKENPGTLIFEGGKSARGLDDGSTWLGIPPVDLSDRIDSALRGMDHEAALWKEVSIEDAQRIRALTKIVRWLRTGNVPTMNRAHWYQVWREIHQNENDNTPPTLTTPSALDVIICTYLQQAYHATIEGHQGSLWLHVHTGAEDDLWRGISKNSDRIAISGPAMLQTA